MLRYAIFGALVLGWVGTASAADKDTSAAAAMRKKLLVKVSLEHKDTMLKEILDDIKGQLEDAKAGSLSIKYDTGVSMNQRMSVSVKDVTLAEALEQLLKKNSMGYVVVSKEKDRYDGWLIIKQGNERGYPAGQEPKDKPATGKAADAEKAAGDKLEEAKKLLKDKKTDDAKKLLEEIVKEHGTTKAAAEAKKELAKLK